MSRILTSLRLGTSEQFLPCAKFSGAKTEDRTRDLRVTSAALCQLSYLGKPSSAWRYEGIALPTELRRHTLKNFKIEALQSQL